MPVGWWLRGFYVENGVAEVCVFRKKCMFFKGGKIMQVERAWAVERIHR